MGMCLGKIKRNRVLPSPDEDTLRRKRKRKGRKQQPDPINPADMMKQLNEAEFEESKITKGGVSFTLELKEGDRCKMPARLANCLDGGNTPTDDEKEIKYTAEEKELLAELLRNDILREKSEKAHKASVGRSQK